MPGWYVCDCQEAMRYKPTLVNILPKDGTVELNDGYIHCSSSMNQDGQKYSTQDIKKYSDNYKVKLCEKAKARAADNGVKGEWDGLNCRDKFCKDAHRDKTFYYVAKKNQPIDKW